MSKMIRKEMTVWEAKNEVNKYPLTTREQCDEYVRVYIQYFGNKHATGFDLLKDLQENQKALCELDLMKLITDGNPEAKTIIKTVHESMDANNSMIIKLQTALYYVNVEQA
jgi:kynurenine formamidase